MSSLSLERFRTSAKYHDRPAAADIAFCVAAIAHGILIGRLGQNAEAKTTQNNCQFKHRIAEVHATSMKCLSKVEAADDPFGWS